MNPEVYQVQKARSLASICKCVGAKQNYGVLHHPLFNIEMEQVSYIIRTNYISDYNTCSNR